MAVFGTHKQERQEWDLPAWDIARLFPSQGSWSEEDYLALNTPHLVEFTNGEVEVLPMPTDRHQSIVAYLFAVFAAYAAQIGGKVLFAPLRVRLGEGKIREPDVVFLADAADPRRQEEYWTGADLVVEVVNPDDPRRDLVTKRFEYAAAGIPEYWIVNPADGTIAVLHLDGERYAEHGSYGRGEIARSAHYPELTVAVADALDAP